MEKTALSFFPRDENIISQKFMIFCTCKDKGIEKWAVVIMKRGTMSTSNGIKLLDDDFIKVLNAEEGPKNIWVL